MAQALVQDDRYHTISSAGTEHLGAEITRLAGYIHAATYRLLVLIREFDQLDGWHQYGLVSCAHWVNFKCGIGINAAREKVRVAHALADLPDISMAFEKGEISYSKVRAMTRVADTSNEGYLLNIARHGTAWHMEKLVQKYRRVKRLRDSESAREQLRQRYLDFRYDDDGCVIIKARVPADQGALHLKALEKAMDDDFSSDDASAETQADGAAVHDAYFEDGPGVTAETSKRLSCDCSVVPVVENGKHEPLSIGRKSRSIPPAIRRALKLRDGGCRFPGCTNTRHVDGHHIRHWAEGGETSLDNLVLLCRRHHRLVHEGDFDCRRSTDGEVYFTGPDDARLPAYTPSPPIEDAACHWFESELAKQDIHALTCVPLWYAGDRMDWQEAVSTLCLLSRHAAQPPTRC